VIAVELAKQTSRLRGWAILGVVAAVSVLLAAVIALSHPSLPERVGNFGAVVPDGSGFTIPLVVMNAAVLFLLPLAVAVFAGDAIAGEAEWGSLRYLLAGPRSRTAVLASKAAVAAAWSAAAVVAVSISSLVAGVVAFGWRPLTVVDLEHTTAFQVAVTTIPVGEALGRVGLATGIVLLSLASTFACGLFLSTLTRSPFSAVAGAVGLGLASRALDNIPGLSALGPWLPLTDSSTTQWTDLFVESPTAGGFGRLAIVQVVYAIVFLGAAWARFARADVLS
jgi:ABC-2 type transport system permease protein